MTKSCALLNFDRLYVTSYDAIWKKGGITVVWILVINRARIRKKSENLDVGVILYISSSDNKSVSHWIMFDYFVHVWKVNIILLFNFFYWTSSQVRWPPLFPHLVPPAIMVWIFVWKYNFEPFIHILQHFVLQLSRQ
jgi:hypothetical protein